MYQTESNMIYACILNLIHIMKLPKKKKKKNVDWNIKHVLIKRIIS